MCLMKEYAIYDFSLYLGWYVLCVCFFFQPETAFRVSGFLVGSGVVIRGRGGGGSFNAVCSTMQPGVGITVHRRSLINIWRGRRPTLGKSRWSRNHKKKKNINATLKHTQCWYIIFSIRHTHHPHSYTLYNMHHTNPHNVSDIFTT